MAPLRAFPTFHLSLCLTLALSTAFAPSLGVAQEAAARPTAAKKHDYSRYAYVVPSSVIVVVAKPAQILNSSAAELFPIEVLQAALIKETGLDPLDAREAVISISPPIAGPPGYTLLATFNSDATLKANDLTRNAEHTTLAGKEYFKSMEPALLAPSLFRPNSKQLLIGPDVTLTPLLESIVTAKKLLEERGESSEGGQLPLVQAAAKAFQDDDLLVMVDAATLRPFIGMGLMQAQLPPELAPLRQIPNLVKLIELRVNVSHSAPTELVLTANDKADADKIVEIYNFIRQTFSEKVDEQARQAIASDDPVEQAGGRYSQRMQKLWDSKLRLTQEDDRIVLFRADLSKSEGNELVYVATIGTLIGLLLPAVQAAREAARRNQSMNNLKQIMLSTLNHESSRKTLPAFASFSDDGKPLLSWRVHLLPYMEQEALYKRFHLDEPWDSEHNRTLIPLMPDLYLTPGSTHTLAEGKTNYVGVIGEDYLFDGSNKGRMLRRILDGTSNTISYVQVDDDAAVPWTKPEDWTPSDSDMLQPFDGPNVGGFLAAFCDGHVQFISSSVDPATLRALLTIDGGETIEAP